MPNQICERTRLLSRPSSLCSLCSVRKCKSIPDLLFSTGLFFHVTFIVTFRLPSASLIAVSVTSILIKHQRQFLFFCGGGGCQSLKRTKSVNQPSFSHQKKSKLHFISPNTHPGLCHPTALYQSKKSQHCPTKMPAPLRALHYVYKSWQCSVVTDVGERLT